ncbi:hypothetical protein RYX36_015655, partial [Vicia faba]
LTPRSIDVEAIRKVLIKLHKGNFLQYSELKPKNRREERHAYFDLFKKKKFSRPPNPDELFMVTHKKKNGKWVDCCSENTHFFHTAYDYVIRLTQATQNDNNVDGSKKQQLWKKAVGGKSQGRCYGTARMAVNIQYGVSYMTQVTISNSNREEESQAIEMERAEASRAC